MGCDDCNIEITNHPMPFTAETQADVLNTTNNMGFNIGFNMAFSMAFVSGFFVLFVIKERVSKSKHLQFVSGVKIHVFLLVGFFWDFIRYLIVIAALLIALVCFQEDGFKTGEEIGRILFVLIYFGWCMLPMVYLAGYVFEIPSTGYTRLALFCIFTGCAVFLIVQVLQMRQLNLESVGNALHWIFLVVPHYSLASGVNNVYTLYSYKNSCNEIYKFCNAQCLAKLGPSIMDMCKKAESGYFAWESPGIGKNILYSYTVGFILIAIVFSIEHKLFAKAAYAFTKQSSQLPQDVPDEDSDVQEEKLKIKGSSHSQLAQQYTLYMKDLTKYYKKFLAVNGLCLGVKNYECFGLLGINGAGKTTSFKMLTGDVRISNGDASINGYSIKSDIKEVQKLIGYCPQFDALLDDLTARETIRMFALLRGIPRGYCDRLGEKLALDFDFKRHLDKQVKELSGGNKRKLSTALALIGDPPVLFLDEPTTGMDPATKRYLWNALCEVRDSGKTIILTSHSMEECEALCTRLAIMVNGNFKCLGSTQHLKHKFAEGYTLTIKVKKPEDSSSTAHAATDQIERFIEENFPRSVLREKHEELLTYYVTDKSVPWSKMFGILERAKKSDLNIEDYSLGQSSLEQVFLTFTKHQYQV